MILVALIASLLAVASGLQVVGTGRDWHFSRMDIVRGRENAVAYVWVTCSTAFSIAHSSVIAFWMGIGGPELVGPQHTNMWMSFHAAMGVLFMSAHVLVKQRLKRTRNMPPSYLWGNR